MSDETIDDREQERLRIYATQQLLVVALRHLIDLSAEPNAARSQIAADFERMALAFEVRSVSGEKAAACRELMLAHGFELLAQVERR